MIYCYFLRSERLIRFPMKEEYVASRAENDINGRIYFFGEDYDD